MTFFNKKEDVMKIELTPHGRRLLAEGKLKPAYYSFFDDDILYDSESGDFVENNTQTKGRILSDTPSLKPQTNYKGVESQYYNSVSPEAENILINPIGTNNLSENKASGWQVSMISGEIDSSTSHITPTKTTDTGGGLFQGAGTSPYLNVPQLECEMNFTASVSSADSVNITFDDSLLDTSFLAFDNSHIELKKSDFIAHLLEKNGFTYKDSLSMEVFLYEEDELSMKKLEFLKKETHIKNEILLDQPDLTQQSNAATIDENTVENYFYVYFDKEIPSSDICRGAKRLKENNIYLGLEIDCKDVDDLEVNIYQTDPDLEDCEI